MSRPARTIATGALIALSLGAAPAAATASAPHAPTVGVSPTPDQIAQIERYHDSGAWARDTAKVTRAASAFLRSAIRRARDPRRLVAVFDVDDTALSTYDCMKAGDFAGARRTPCVVLTPHPAIRQTLALFKLAQSSGVSVAFVTGRPDGTRPLTLDQLRAAGYRGRYELLLRPGTDARHSVVPFKSSARKRLARGGRTVAINVGDQRSDLAGGTARRTFKLPNPMYTLP